MFKSIGCSRFAYNWALNRCNELYEDGLKYSMANIRKEFTRACGKPTPLGVGWIA